MSTRASAQPFTCTPLRRQHQPTAKIAILSHLTYNHIHTHIHKYTYTTDKDKQKEVELALKRELKMSYHIVDMTDASEPEPVLLSKHAKNLLRFLHLLPARMSSHDNTR